MRVCVIGTSNAIYAEGYCGGIAADPRVTSFRKYCIGASPSVIVPYFSAQIDFGQFDWVIFDTAINDRNYYKFDSIRKDQIRQFIEHGIATAAASGCRSALLVMPSRRLFDKRSIGRLIYTKLATEHDLPIVDGFDFVDGIVASGEIASRDEAFIDDFHILKPLARRAGVAVLEQIAQRPRALPQLLRKRSFRVQQLGVGDRALRRSSSIASADFMPLDPAGIQIAAGDDEELVGLSFNAGLTTGSVSDGGGMVKSLRTRYAGQGKSFLLLVSPIVTPGLRPRNGKLNLLLAGPGAETTEHSRFEHLPALAPGTEPYVELEAAIFARTLWP